LRLNYLLYLLTYYGNIKFLYSGIPKTPIFYGKPTNAKNLHFKIASYKAPPMDKTNKIAVAVP
jgi:hypothetical protein